MDSLLELAFALPSDKEHEIEQKVAAEPASRLRPSDPRTHISG